uniref:NADH dehydrogenase subunit 6 n=1 Tax=Entemnotrochus adansonianus TaxID=121186 RepID=UPI001E75E33E|nr:NADH dehydrogenase subunit 6 [Entemnotrochus adansonianus]UDL72138.1 NADH dehydrogenase subunit 6 [Entemnotrochus adansonianus]
MTVLIVFSFSVSIMFLMPMMMQPLSLGLCVMLMSLFSCVLIAFCMSSWFGYVLFLIYVGGLLVMFAYVSALAPNSFFSGMKSFILFVVVFSVLVLMGGMTYFKISGFGVWVDFFSIDKGYLEAGGALVNPASISLMVALGIILLINLLAVVKICYYQQGALRCHEELG